MNTFLGFIVYKFDDEYYTAWFTDEDSFESHKYDYRHGRFSGEYVTSDYKRLTLSLD